MNDAAIRATNRTTTENRGVRRCLLTLCKGALLACTVALGLLATAGAAQASSIVFIRAGDVWLTTPDGSRELRVTSGYVFNDVSQADDGTIFAEGNGVLRRFAPDGRELAPPAGTASLFDLDVSPDGSKIAFWYPSYDGGRASVINADGSSAGWDDNNGEYMQWASNDLAIYSNGAGWINTFIGPGYPCCNGWFATNPDGRKYAPAITRAGDKLAVVFRDWDPDDPAGGPVGPYKIAWYANSSPPPRDEEVFGEEPDERPTHRCTVVSGDAQPEHPSFSPDGSAIAWEHPDGVRVQPALDLNSCTQPGGGFTIPGARSPDWGPADVPPPPAPPPPAAEPPPAAAPSPGPGGAAPLTPVAPGGQAEPLFPAKLQVKRARVIDGKLDLLVGITGRASGQLKVRYQAAGRTIAFAKAIGAPQASQRDVVIRHSLTGRQRTLSTGIVEIDYAGNQRTQPDAVRLRAARGRSLLRRTKLDLDGRELTIAGTTSRRVGGVVRLRVTYTGGEWNGRARIKSGRWTLTDELPAAATTDPNAYLTAQFTGDRTTTTGPHRGEQLGKGL